jgi:hypothetical protein
MIPSDDLTNREAKQSAAELMPLLYAELRRLAGV